MRITVVGAILVVAVVAGAIVVILLLSNLPEKGNRPNQGGSQI